MTVYRPNYHKKLGEGSEKRVYEEKNNPELAVGLFKDSNLIPGIEIKSCYYLANILHLFFPREIPKIRHFSSNPVRVLNIFEPANNMIVSTKVEHGQLNVELNELQRQLAVAPNYETRHKLQVKADEIRKKIKNHQSVIDLQQKILDVADYSIDTNGVSHLNLTKNKDDGKEQVSYLDTTFLAVREVRNRDLRTGKYSITNMWINFDPVRLRHSIEQIKNKKTQDQAKQYYDRLIKIILAFKKKTNCSFWGNNQISEALIFNP